MKYSVVTFGCRVNQADSLGFEEELRARGATSDGPEHADVVIVVGANPTDGHPVFASRLKKRLREGAKLIVIDPRRIDLVRMPHIEAAYHLPLKPGANVAVMTSLARKTALELTTRLFTSRGGDFVLRSEWPGGRAGSDCDQGARL